MNKPVVMFVDDEPNILSGLRRLTRAKRDVWDMRFVEGGDAGLSLLAEEHVDAVVSDMRMPGIDGPRLLQEVANRQPGVLRVILSGEADREMTYRTVGVSHRFLSKPCLADDLIGAIEGPLLLRGQGGRACGEFYSTLGISSALNKVFSAGEPHKEALVELALHDPALCARLLQLANSAYFGRPVRTASLETAIEAVGVATIKALHQRDALVAHAPPDQQPSVNAAVDYATKISAAAAAMFANNVPADCINDARVAGLLSALPRIGRRFAVEAPASRAYCVGMLGLPSRMIRVMRALDSEQVEPSAEQAGLVIWRALDAGASGQP